MSRLGVGDAKEKNEGKGSHGQDLASTLSKIPAAEGFEEVTGSDLCLESVAPAVVKGRDCGGTSKSRGQGGACAQARQVVVLGLRWWEWEPVSRWPWLCWFVGRCRAEEAPCISPRPGPSPPPPTVGDSVGVCDVEASVFLFLT